MTDKLEALKAAALAATPGPWVAFLSGDTFAVHTPSDKHCGDLVNWPGFDGSKNAANNAAFIAAVNPAVVLELLAALEEANSKNYLADMLEWRRKAEEVDKRMVTQNRHVCELFDEAKMLRDRAEASGRREEHLKATVDVLSAKNAELEQRLQQPIKLRKCDIGIACEFISEHVVVSLAAVLAEAATAGFKAEVEGE
jgi:hypothetical protein